jgi:hypothetical protein
MQSVSDPAQLRARMARKSPRKLPKTASQQGHGPAPDPAQVNLQQAGAEPAGRGAGDWPPNTWWP